MATHNRFLTTHIGSLPRQEEQMQIMFAREDGLPMDPVAVEHKITSDVNDVVARQIKAQHPCRFGRRRSGRGLGEPRGAGAGRRDCQSQILTGTP